MDVFLRAVEPTGIEEMEFDCLEGVLIESLDCVMDLPVYFVANSVPKVEYGYDTLSAFSRSMRMGS